MDLKNFECYRTTEAPYARLFSVGSSNMKLIRVLSWVKNSIFSTFFVLSISGVVMANEADDLYEELTQPETATNVSAKKTSPRWSGLVRVVTVHAPEIVDKYLTLLSDQLLSHNVLFQLADGDERSNLAVIFVANMGNALENEAASLAPYFQGKEKKIALTNCFASFSEGDDENGNRKMVIGAVLISKSLEIEHALNCLSRALPAALGFPFYDYTKHDSQFYTFSKNGTPLFSDLAIELIARKVGP